jgi:hypothetical protein
MQAQLVAAVPHVQQGFAELSPDGVMCCAVLQVGVVAAEALVEALVEAGAVDEVRMNPSNGSSSRLHPIFAVGQLAMLHPPPPPPHNRHMSLTGSHHTQLYLEPMQQQWGVLQQMLW